MSVARNASVLVDQSSVQSLSQGGGGAGNIPAVQPAQDRLQQAAALALAARTAANDQIARLMAEPINTSARSAFLVGKSGVGKTTVAHLLSDGRVKGQHDPDENVTKIVPVDPRKGMDIGMTRMSETNFPNICVGVNPANREERVVVVDCPGFDDSRGVIQQIAHGVCFQKLFELYPTAQLVIVIRADDIMSSRGGALNDFVGFLNRMFGGAVDAMIGRCSLVVTQARNFHTVADIQTNINEVIADLRVEESHRHILESLRDRCVIFYRPRLGFEGIVETDQLASTIFDRIRGGNYVPQPRIRVCLSDTARQEVLVAHAQLVGYVNEKNRECMTILRESLTASLWQYRNSARGASQEQQVVLLNDLTVMLAALRGVVIVDDTRYAPNPMLLHCAQAVRTTRNISEVVREIGIKFELASYLRQFLDGEGCTPFTVSQQVRDTVGDCQARVREAYAAIRALWGEERVVQERRRQQEEQERVAREQEWSCIIL